MPNLTWNAYLCRVDGALVVREQPPVCESCEGSRSLLGTDMRGHPCTRCSGTGLGWHVRIVPTAGWLVERKSHNWTVMFDAAPGLACVGGMETGGNTKAICAPLLPPADTAGTSPLELLGLLPDCEVEDNAMAYIRHYHEGSIVAYMRCWLPPRPTFQPVQLETLNTAPLRLAIQRHEALQQWLGGKHG
jgi:hypothetical protein